MLYIVWSKNGHFSQLLGNSSMGRGRRVGSPELKLHNSVSSIRISISIFVQRWKNLCDMPFVSKLDSIAESVLMFLGVRAVRGRPDLGLSLILSFLWRVSEHWEQFVARFSTFFRFPFNSFLACQFSLALGLCLALGLGLDLVLALSLGLSVKNVP